jgi:hypothetical protein
MRTNTTDAVVVPCSEFLLISTKADKRHFHLLVFNTITGKTNSVLLSGNTPECPEGLLIQFIELLGVVDMFGFKSIEDLYDTYTKNCEEISMLDIVTYYRDMCEQSLFCLNVVGSHSRMREIQEYHS